MLVRQLLACILTAFVMMPESGALKLDKPPGEISQSVGVYEPLHEFKKRGVKFSIHSTEKALKPTNDIHPVQITLANDGSKPLTFLKWGSPFEEKISNMIIHTEPRTSSYLGYIVNRKPKALPETALITVQPGTEVTATVDLNEYMAFHEKRHYEVSFNFLLLMFDTDDTDTSSHQDKLINPTKSIQQMMSTTFDVEVESPRTKAEVDELFAPDAGSEPDHKFIGCTDQDINILYQAIDAAHDMTADALLRSKQSDGSTERYMYEQWLGQSQECPLFAQAITLGFDRMLHQAFDKWEERQYAGQGFIPNCGKCRQSPPGGMRCEWVYAYVYPHDPYHTVYLCCAIWNDRVKLGPHYSDSFPGTMIHELAHFADIFGTTDHDYGTYQNQRLASHNACVARENSDNIQAFAEAVDCPNYYCRGGVDPYKDGKERRA